MKILNKSLLVGLLLTFLFSFILPTLTFAIGPLPVDLGTAGNFVILGETAITTTVGTSIVGNIGISPAAASYLTGFGQIMDVSNTFSSSSLVTGKIYAANYTAPTPAYMTTAVNDMTTAYTNAAGRTLPATTTNLYSGLISGHTFTPGLYKWTTDVSMTASAATATDVTLSGGPNDVWIFQISGDLTSADGGDISNGAKIVLTGGAVASNIFWQVGGPTGATLGSYSTFKGTILSAKQIIFNTGAVLDGRALSQTQVTLIANSVSIPTDYVEVAFIPPAVSSGSRIIHGTISVVKTVINDNGGTKVISDFPLFVNDKLVVSGETNSFIAFATYRITETSDPNYTQSFSGDCNANGVLDLSQNQNKVCIITNNDIGFPRIIPVVQPLIDIVKIPSPLALPNGPGLVTYTYTVRNIGTVPMNNITLVGDSCSPIVIASGDTNNDSKLDVNETWIYKCSTILSETHTNNVVATGWANNISSVDIASATVVVGTSVVPPLIHVTKIPSPSTLLSGGGNVTYVEKITNPGNVALNNIRISDDKCAPVNYITGDINNDSILDTNETWYYICRARLSKTTTNTVTVSGDANGLSARDFAIATVIVSGATPKLPNTGIDPNNRNSIPWFVIPLGLFLTIFIVYLIKNKPSTYF